jgi:hypothetical protein
MLILFLYESVRAEVLIMKHVLALVAKSANFTSAHILNEQEFVSWLVLALAVPA